MNLKKKLIFTLGIILVSLGAIGMVLPVIPTTPFLLVAAFCFGKSSKRAEKWISNNKYFGGYIENYRSKKGIPLTVKRNSLIYLWVMLVISSIFLRNLFMTVVLAIVGICVSTHILLIKTKK